MTSRLYKYVQPQDNYSHYRLVAAVLYLNITMYNIGLVALAHSASGCLDQIPGLNFVHVGSSECPFQDYLHEVPSAACLKDDVDVIVVLNDHVQFYDVALHVTDQAPRACWDGAATPRNDRAVVFNLTGHGVQSCGAVPLADEGLANAFYRVRTTVAAGPAEPHFCEAALANQLAECEQLGNVVHCAEAAVPALVRLLGHRGKRASRWQSSSIEHLREEEILAGERGPQWLDTAGQVAPSHTPNQQARGHRFEWRAACLLTQSMALLLTFC